MLGALKRLFDSNEKQLNRIQSIVDEINALEDYAKELSDEALSKKTKEFRKKLGFVSPEDIDWEEDYDKEEVREKLFEILPEAFAIVRESANRHTQHRHFDVQLIAGYVLAKNKISELFTGEGKTNAATLALYLYALTGRGAHLVTVNDYLARRDGEWSGHVLKPLGMTVGVINSGNQYRYITDEEAIELKGDEAREAIEERKKMQKKVGRLKLDLMEGVNLVQCTKSEVYACDVVYGTNNEFGFDYLRDNMARNLEDRVQRRLHYAIVDEADSILIDEARTPLIISQSAQASNDLYTQFSNIVTNLSTESDYVVDEKANSVAITDDGIDKVEKALGVDNVYEDASYAYHLDNALKAKELYKRDDEYIVRNGQILIVDEFTGRAMEGRRYSEGLHQAIEAKEGVQVQRESKTLATITLQNYFRLYDFLAGMTATALTEAEEFADIYDLDVVVVPTNEPVIREDKNDVVYRTEDSKFRAIIRDIKEHYEKGQPILVGTASVEKSEILSHLLQKEGIKHNVLNAKHHEREAKIIQEAGQKGSVTIATNMAGRGTDISLGEGVPELGGLYVIGSERHEARRIDNQLRGRSGRQGDPGLSRFYVSFEDDLMRLFGGERMQIIMNSVGMDDDMPISLGLLGRTIANAQKRVEAHNFDIRKRLVEYDDVLSQQRDIVYSLRKKILELLDEKDVDNNGGKLDKSGLKDLEISDLTKDLEQFSLKNESTWQLSEIDEFGVVKHPMNYWILKRIIREVRTYLSSQLVDDMQIEDDEERKIVKYMNSLLTEELIEEASGALGFNDSLELFKEFDRTEELPTKIDLLLKLTVIAFVLHVNRIGAQAMNEFSRLLVLQTVDNYWMEHLDAMGNLREGIGMRSIAQRDPLVEYKNEGFNLFEKMLGNIDKAIADRFFKVRIVKKEQVREPIQSVHEQMGSMLPQKNSAQDVDDQRPGDMSKQKTIVKKYSDIGRNDPCPCGSGKKYKKCHLDKKPQSASEKRAFNLYFDDRDKWDKEFS